MNRDINQYLDPLLHKLPKSQNSSSYPYSLPTVWNPFRTLSICSPRYTRLIATSSWLYIYISNNWWPLLLLNWIHSPDKRIGRNNCSNLLFTMDRPFRCPYFHSNRPRKAIRKLSIQRARISLKNKGRGRGKRPWKLKASNFGHCLQFSWDSTPFSGKTLTLLIPNRYTE